MNHALAKTFVKYSWSLENRSKIFLSRPDRHLRGGGDRGALRLPRRRRGELRGARSAVDAGATTVLEALAAHEPTLARIGEGAVDADPVVLARFLRRVSPALRCRVAGAIPADAWRRAQEEAPLTPTHWYSLARCLRDGQRADLGRAAAVALLRKTDGARWEGLLGRKDPMSVAAFAAVAVGQTDEPELVGQVLRTHWTPEWLETAQERTRTQSLAAAMLALAESNLPHDVVQTLSGDSLRRRLERELQHFASLRGHALERVVALYGSASLLLGEIAQPSEVPPITAFIDMLDNLRLPEPSRLPVPRRRDLARRQRDHRVAAPGLPAAAGRAPCPTDLGGGRPAGRAAHDRQDEDGRLAARASHRRPDDGSRPPRRRRCTRTRASRAVLKHQVVAGPAAGAAGRARAGDDGTCGAGRALTYMETSSRKTGRRRRFTSYGGPYSRGDELPPDETETRWQIVRIDQPDDLGRPRCFCLRV